MRPNGPALEHPAAPLLIEFATDGPKTGIDLQHPLTVLEAAIKRGAHPSAEHQDAAKALRLETLEKVQQGFARLVPWTELRKHLPPNLKLSPIAAIPHKSRAYRMILDLSFAFKVDNVIWPSVNDSTDRATAPLQSMAQLGKVLPRIIHALATLPTDQGPVMLMKADIKDGFWRIAVPTEEEPNFAYVLPSLNPTTSDNDIQIVIPSALQMGWTSSPPIFCAATETARDVAEQLRLQPNLPTHPLEDKTIQHQALARACHLLHTCHQKTPWTEQNFPQRLASLNHLFEVFVDDFIGLVQCTDETVLRHHTRALFHAIHSIFPPVTVTGHDGEDPISEKKLNQGEGVWDTRKEILGWICDGVARTIELPPPKVEKLVTRITTILRHKHCTPSELQSLLGSLQHATLGIPSGRGLLAPLYKLLSTKDSHPPNKHKRRHTITIPTTSAAYRVLYDYRTLIKLIGARPTKCAQLIPGMPAYVGFCDACKYGAGGVWCSGSKPLHPIVWRIPWPASISEALITRDNPHGTLTINDLEMAGLLLHYLVLEQLVDMLHQHVAAWVDNTSTVSWATKLSSSKSVVGQRLVRALCLRLCANQSSPLAAWSIAGALNGMADLASRSFRKTGPSTYNLTNSQFLVHFNSTYPLTQEASWRLFQLSNRVSSLVFSELQTEMLPMGSWMRLKQKGHAIGTIGASSSDPKSEALTWTPCSKSSLINNELTSSVPSLQESDPGLSAKAIKSAVERFKSRSVPLARPSNWLNNPTPPTTPTPSTKPPTGSGSPNCLKPTSGRTLQPKPN